MVERARRSVGATIAAARAALAEASPPTWAAARTTRGGARLRLLRLQRRRGRPAPDAGRGRRCAFVVIDLDVHQGNGTAAIFAGDEACSRSRCTASATFRSARRRDLDVGLPDGCDDAAYLAALDRRSTSLAAHAARRPAWRSMWPAPIRTRATASAG